MPALGTTRRASAHPRQAWPTARSSRSSAWAGTAMPSTMAAIVAPVIHFARRRCRLGRSFTAGTPIGSKAVRSLFGLPLPAVEADGGSGEQLSLVLLTGPVDHDPALLH